ncbi:MAG: redoxin domain-containing protein [Acidobacteria bacterium]|nr:redoxin domain-containing protein [Acidobacteriota bacterium]
MVVISYDSVQILADYAKRRKITFPMLSDPRSEIIRAFRIVNTSVPQGHMWSGVPYPGTYIVDQNGVVRAKYFEQHYRDRYSAPTILLREFGSVVGTHETSVKTDYLELKYYSTRDVVHPNLRLTLVADFQLPPKMHVYAPGVANYIPIRLELQSSPNFVGQPAEYPKPEVLHLPAIDERVAVYRGKFRITQDVTIAGASVLRPVLEGSGELEISGKLRYQACDEKICYLPQELPLEWTLKAEPLDSERVPESIQHK